MPQSWKLRKIIFGLLIVCATSKPGLAFAVDGATISVGGAELLPTLGFTQTSRDNYLLQAEGAESAAISLVNPKLELMLGDNTTVLGVALDYQAGRYAEHDEDNFDDVSIDAQLSMEFNQRNQLDLNAEFADKHEFRGTGYSQGLAALELDKPDTYEQQSIGARYRFGAQSAKGRLIFAVNDWSREYTSRRELTAGQNRDELRLSSTFLWRAGGRTDVLVEFRDSDIDYTVDPLGDVLTLDSRDNRYYLGISWEATGKTVGSIRLGQATKDFVSPIREDFSGFSWEIGANWSPKTYSTFSISTSRAPRETVGFGSFIVAETFDFDWEHDWSDRFASTLYYHYLSEEYRDADADAERDAVRHNLGLKLDYALYRWFDMGVSIQHADNQANIAQYEYEENQVALHLLWSL